MSANPAVATGPDWRRLRADFPALGRRVHGKPLVYLDNANTAQRPEPVLVAMDRYYREYNANVSRAVHTLGSEATAAYEAVRDVLAAFLNAPSREGVVLTRGTTEAINLVAHSWGSSHLRPGDAVLLTGMEHHANIVPWQLACERAGAHLKVVPVTDAGELDMDALPALLTPDVRLFAFVHVSNALGTVNPARALCAMARERGVPTLVDGSQAAPHLPVDVQAIGCDFYVITGHKMFGPTGSGALWGRPELLAAMPPFMGGGEMIREVRFEGSTYADPPHRFEAGTPNIAGLIGLGAAAGYLAGIGMEAIADRERELGAHARRCLSRVPGLRLIGADAAERVPVFSFVVDGAQAQDVATLIDLDGIAVRSGHHCTHPLMRRFGVPATCRASLAFYNTEAEVDALAEALERARSLLA
ncbi:MAG: cysteine desulfurase [Xanthomonadales bacterium]|nr:cysteine desulfurase [Xanthomonadales bacterium]